MKLAVASLASALVVVLGACSTNPIRMEAVAPDGRLGREARIVLSAAGEPESSVVVGAEGRHDDTFAGRSTDTVRLSISVFNGSDSAVSVPLDAMRVTDDLGHVFTRLAAYLPPEQPATEVLVQPHVRTSFEVLFDVGAPGLLQTVGSVTLHWQYVFRGASLVHDTRFIPVHYVRRSETTTFIGVGYYR